jgi:hypothetical protein
MINRAGLAIAALMIYMFAFHAWLWPFRSWSLFILVFLGPYLAWKGLLILVLLSLPCDYVWNRVLDRFRFSWRLAVVTVFYGLVGYAVAWMLYPENDLYIRSGAVIAMIYAMLVQAVTRLTERASRLGGDEP